jgi:hypothetical protein
VERETPLILAISSRVRGDIKGGLSLGALSVVRIKKPFITAHLLV